MISGRIQKIVEMFQQDGADSLLLTKGGDIRYLSGFTGEDGVAVILLTKEKYYFITDGRFINQALTETDGFEIIRWKTGTGLFRETGQLIQEIGLSETALDHAAISHKSYCILKEHTECLRECAKEYPAILRRVKDDEELQLIRKACEITQASFLAMLDQVKPGKTEKDIRNILEFESRKRGSNEVSFTTIVASGPDNGANPHAALTDREVQKGDMITVDFGASYEGYCADITRTFAVGKPDERLREIYKVVKEAKDCASAQLKEGVKAKEIDFAARSVIEKAGYTLPHGPGHGFGLNIHEIPFLGMNNEYCMEENVVHTIEPGIYVPGIGGVRIEDDYRITKNGVELLTAAVEQNLMIL